MDNKRKILTLKTINKSNVWELQENDIFRMWEAAERDADLKDNSRHYLDIIRSAFEIEFIAVDKPEVIAKYEQRGFKVGIMKTDDSNKIKMGIKKRVIMRITDLTYENIRHISAEKLIEILDRNFGGGWDSIPQRIKDIIETGFDISTTTLPKDRLKKAGGMYEKKVDDGFEVLEIEKGSWVEAIFAKAKPAVEKPSAYVEKPDSREKNEEGDDDDDDEEDLPEERLYDEEEEDPFDEDKLTEESYRTTYDKEESDDLTLAEDVADDYDA